MGARDRKKGISVTRNSESLTVLLVEDDPAALTFYSDALFLSGFRVVQAKTGTEALIRARAERPDVVVADLGLPDFDGFEVCRQLHLEPLLRHVPAIALTGRSMALRDIELAERAGFSAVLLKPASPETIADAIHNARRKSGAARPRSLRAPIAPIPEA